MYERLLFNFVKTSFEEDSYILVSTRYKNAHTKLKYICNKGHKHSITFDKWSQGKRCPYCAGNAKLTIAYIAKMFKKYNYTLVSDKYINANSKLKYVCSRGHLHSITWGHWKSGKRCPKCWAIDRFGEGNPAWKGGVSFEPYCAIWKDKEYKSDIKERDGNRCLNPYCYNTDDVTVIHHIDYNKKNCRLNNLITVCRSCNGKANKDRNWHKAWYQAVIKNRYNY